ncbi:MAG: BtrH N-terminal domain-containing protein [Candidatus Pacebacteria bacterium]|nr:BtrH N-terminal domain-containing protein [Candidatus Paceibacterota bacterium]PIP74793.1 MAG: hypothetical protein COW87_01950 [Candidatus Levybacteria bacterium CG22_combo_CG10-13_8_21_14_all_35_11]
MDNRPDKYSLKNKPAEYLKQGLSHCGAYAVKGILSSMGLDKTNHPKEYHPSLLGRLSGITFGRDYYPRILSKYGIKATPKSAIHLSDNEKINLLKDLLLKGNPAMLSIGNGYLSNNRYNKLQGLIMGHWITVWGYDNDTEEFLVYDSAVPENEYKINLPVGNTTRTYKEMLRDWKGALLARLVRSNEYYHYIEIKSP